MNTIMRFPPTPGLPLCAYEQFHVPVRLLKHSNAFLTQKYVEFYNSAQRQKENQEMAYQKKKKFYNANTIWHMLKIARSTGELQCLSRGR